MLNLSAIPTDNWVIACFLANKKTSYYSIDGRKTTQLDKAKVFNQDYVFRKLNALRSKENSVWYHYNAMWLGDSDITENGIKFNDWQLQAELIYIARNSVKNNSLSIAQLHYLVSLHDEAERLINEFGRLQSRLNDLDSIEIARLEKINKFCSFYYGSKNHLRSVLHDDWLDKILSEE